MSKATATQIGNSKKERITYGDDTIRKSVDIGKYNYLCLYFRDGNDLPYIGANSTRENAGKWSPCPASVDLYPARKSDTQEKKDDVNQRYTNLTKRYGKSKRISQRGHTFYRFSVPFTRTIVKIER